jgi:hypothetical protein
MQKDKIIQGNKNINRLMKSNGKSALENYEDQMRAELSKGQRGKTVSALNDYNQIDQYLSA